MRALTVVCFGFGCGFASRAASDGGSSPGGDGSAAELDARSADAAPPDAAVLDGTGAGNEGTNDCIGRWIDHTVQFTAPRQLTELSSAISATMTTTEHDPWVSEDGLRLYFARNPGMKGGSDIYLATRVSPTASFGTPENLVNLNSDADEDRPALSGDELTIVIARNPTIGTGKARILLARREQSSSPLPSTNDDLTQIINAGDTDHRDPFLSRDGLRLYFAPTGTTGFQQIRVAARASTSAAFSAPAAVRGVDRSNASDADPAVSNDERILVFSSTDLGGTNLWYATRLVAGDDFGAPVPIMGLNSVVSDSDPMLSADGCELYFSSTRGSGRHIYRAAVKR